MSETRVGADNAVVVNNKIDVGAVVDREVAARISRITQPSATAEVAYLPYGMYSMWLAYASAALIDQTLRHYDLFGTMTDAVWYAVQALAIMGSYKVWEAVVGREAYRAYSEFDLVQLCGAAFVTPFLWSALLPDAEVVHQEQSSQLEVWAMRAGLFCVARILLPRAG